MGPGPQASNIKPTYLPEVETAKGPACPLSRAQSLGGSGSDPYLFMRLYFSTDHVRNSTITNEQGQVLYKVITPFRPIFMKGISTIWKIIPNTTPLYSTRANESYTEFEPNGEDSDDPDIAPVDEEEPELELEEQEEEIILDMQDQFAELAQIKFHRFQTSLIRWFGLNQLGRGEVSTKEFMPSRGIARRLAHLTIFGCVALTPFQNTYVHWT